MTAIELYVAAVIAMIIIALYGISFAMSAVVDLLDQRINVLNERMKLLEDKRANQD
jgi:hypothetical protein